MVSPSIRTVGIGAGVVGAASVAGVTILSLKHFSEGHRDFLANYAPFVPMGAAYVAYAATKGRANATVGTASAHWGAASRGLAIGAGSTTAAALTAGLGLGLTGKLE